MVTNNKRWQAPGNGKIFDNRLGSSSYMNKRAICVLKYIQKKSKVSQKEFEDEIKNYLVSCANYEKNSSLATHFFRPLLFLGFIEQDDKLNLELTIEGIKFLNAYKNKNFEDCKTYILNQLDNVKYPNRATKNVEINIFPFRILFKLLLENHQKGLSTNFIKEQLVYIAKIEDLTEYIKTKKVEDIKKYNEYNKFYTWVINSLVDIEILKKVSNNYFISDDLLEQIKALYENLSFDNFFFKKELLYCEINIQTAKQRYKRDHKIIIEAKERDSFVCKINKEHKTFISKGENYIEGHHIIPMFQQKNYNFNLDNIKNIISLCPNCHKEVHLADNKETIINNLYELNKDYLKSKDISLNDVYKMYC